MKYTRIWDTLPTSKMELFVTISIYKVIFRRLMILYTQYSFMSVFICVSSLPAPFCSRWFHLQASEMVLFVTITITNIVFYWEMVLHVQFLPMNFFFFCVNSLLSPSRYRWFQVVPARSRWFKLLLVVPARSSWFQLVPPFSIYENCIRETKRSQRNEISLNLLFCDYFSTIFIHYLEILSKYNQI